MSESIMKRTIAVGGLFIECNHLGGRPADMQAFLRSEYLRGADLLAVRAGTVGGMLDRLQNCGHAVRPLLMTSACPSGVITADCYARLRGELLGDLERSLPCDGVLLALHGAAAAEGIDDVEGDLLAAVRERVGDATPIVGALDHHAHVTRTMVESADGFVAWDTYPHRDAWETGCRAASMLDDILTGALRPTMALAKVPLLVSGVLGHTDGPGPFADVMRHAKQLECDRRAYSASAFLVHPYLDADDMGGGGLVITHDDLAGAGRLARELALQYWSKRSELEPDLVSPVEAIARGRAMAAGPVILVETADCCGGGAAGDSAATLRCLLDSGIQQPSLIPIVDPAAAQACHAAGIGAELTLNIGHSIDPGWGKPVNVSGKVVAISDGTFTYRGGIWEGRQGQMGPAARFDVGSIQIALASHPTYEWCGEQFEILGMQPQSARFVVAKNPMNYQLAFGAYCRAAFILDTPGPTPATLRHVRHRRLRRPYFPADQEIPGLQPTVYTHEYHRR